MAKMRLLISRDGRTMVHVYNDKLRPLETLGKTKTTRASDVERAENGLWEARLHSTGEVIASAPSREDTLALEKERVEEKLSSYV